MRALWSQSISLLFLLLIITQCVQSVVKTPNKKTPYVRKSTKSPSNTNINIKDQNLASSDYGNLAFYKYKKMQIFCF